MICPKCNSQNTFGALICAKCGALLAEVPSISTTFANDTSRNPAENPLVLDTIDPAIEGTLAPNTVALYIDSSLTPLLVAVPDHVVIGRRATQNKIQPQVDLTDYGAYKFGVSRLHAAIGRTPTGYNVEDLASSNGTWLNGVRLAPHEIRDLAPKDQLVLGKIRISLYFENTLVEPIHKVLSKTDELKTQ